ncbi:MAG: class I SAM-dependent methyltransferase, partial [Kiritimatiellia bacterium]|nr:class I SAM-dependent methyltransferase [Kiritimatiellia bacterium]
AVALPVLRGVMGAQGSAYGYLKESMGKMPNGDDFLAELAGAGFAELRCRRLGLGMCSLFTGVRV